jgi:diguanylate cyclase (GGDEF)-like protein
MTAAPATTKSRPDRPDLIRSRPARVGVALLVVLVVAAGIWGALSATQSVLEYREAKQVESAIEQARYSLALERSAVRAAGAARARQELSSAAGTFAAAMGDLKAAHGGDAAGAAGLERRHERLLDTAYEVLMARGAGFSSGYERRSFESQAAALDSALTGVLGDDRIQSVDSWPAQPLQKVELGAIGLLVVLGLVSATVFLTHLAGYRRRLERSRRDELKRLERAALSDNLTGLGNHRAFYDDLKREIERRARTGSGFSIVMLDLDGLKEINDTLGHQAGDERIRAVADCLEATLRDGGAYRTGGDEFMVLMPNERAWGALVFSQRLHAELAERRGGLRVSCGIAETAGLESADTLVHHADLALYEAKRSGRRVVVFSKGLSPKPTAEPERLASRRHQHLLATALAQAVDAKDAGTRNHCETVSALCVLIGQALGLSDERVEQLGIAGLLHDVGKIGIADALLQKQSKLEPEERAVMNNHVIMGRSIVAAAGLEEEASWILHHHEHIDGSGYPEGISGPEIPLESRIIRVADAFEAMTANRPYSPASHPADAFVELERGIGTQFDARCVEALRSALGSDVATASRWFAPAEETPKPAVPSTVQVASA